MIDIFYKSYSKDFKWLYYSLDSVKKFISGYRKIHIVIPSKEQNLFDRSKLADLNYELHLVDEVGDGYLYQQFIKLTAFEYSDADFIYFVDSDCVFYKTTNLEDLLEDNKPEILYTDYKDVGDAICWKQPTEKYLGVKVQYEFMRRLPFFYRRDTLIRVAQLNKHLQQYILSQDQFSEFNVLGQYQFLNEKDNYRFVNTQENNHSKPIVDQQHFSFDENDRLKKINDIMQGLYDID